MMEVENRFKIRFMRPDEVVRITQLINDLHEYQRMKGVEKPPNEEACKQDLLHRNERGELVANNRGTFVAVAIDKSKEKENCADQSYIIGYLIYTQSFFLKHGRQMYVNSFFIDNNYRRHGIGTLFMRFFSLHARLLGNDRFDVPFMKNNYIGQKFYKRLGAYPVDDQYLLFSIKP